MVDVMTYVIVDAKSHVVLVFECAVNREDTALPYLGKETVRWMRDKAWRMGGKVIDCGVKWRKV